MKNKTLFALVLVFALAGGLVHLYQAGIAADATSAMLTSVKGKVAVQAKGSGSWQQATNKMTVKDGDTVKTSSGASAIVKFKDGSMIKIGPMSATKISATGTGKSVDMESGKTWSRVRKLDKESDFKIKTPTAVAGVRGTFFSSEAEEAQSQFDVFDGEVVVSNTDESESVSVTAHQRTTVGAGKAPAAPSEIPADEESAGRDGFSQEEYTSATFEIQISISAPQGNTATVTAQVLKNGEPYQKEVDVKLTLSGSAKFAANGSNEITATTDGAGTLSLQISNDVQESVNVGASLLIKVAQ